MSQRRDYSLFPKPHLHRIEPHIHHDPTSGCWLWDGALSHDGYAQISTYDHGGRNRKSWYVHRVLYFALVGYVSTDLQMDHKCRTRCCVNPAHLEPVTDIENKRRSPLFGDKKTHCPLGHEYTASNVRWIVNAKYRMRACRICTNRKQREYTMRKRTALAASAV